MSVASLAVFPLRIATLPEGISRTIAEQRRSREKRIEKVWEDKEHVWLHGGEYSIGQSAPLWMHCLFLIN